MNFLVFLLVEETSVPHIRSHNKSLPCTREKSTTQTQMDMGWNRVPTKVIENGNLEMKKKCVGDTEVIGIVSYIWFFMLSDVIWTCVKCEPRYIFYAFVQVLLRCLVRGETTIYSVYPNITTLNTLHRTSRTDVPEAIKMTTTWINTNQVVIIPTTAPVSVSVSVSVKNQYMFAN